jgi:glutathione S-transferase
MSNWILYYSPGACSFAAHSVLYELGRPFSVRAVMLAQGAHLKAEYLAINPRARVPTLIIDGKPITELSGILTWLGQQGEGLFPKVGTIEAAECGEWLGWLTSTVHISFAMIWRPARFLVDENLHDALKAHGRTLVESQFDEIETRLARGPYALGANYSVADPNLLVFYRWGNRIGLPMRARFPDWTAHAERMVERPAVRAAIEAEKIEIWAAPA